MPKFLVIGVGQGTRRKRQRTFEAKDEAHARALAEADGTIVDSAERLPWWKSGTDHGFPLCEDQIIELWLHRLLHRFAWPPRLPSAVGPKPPKNRGLSPIIIENV